MLFILYVLTFLLAVGLGFLLGERRHLKRGQTSAQTTITQPNGKSAATVAPSAPLPAASSAPELSSVDSSAFLSHSSSKPSVTIVDSESDDEQEADSALPAPLVTRSAPLERRRVVIVAKQLPLKTIKDPVTGQWSLEWDDSRNFLSGIAKLRSNSAMDIKWVGIPNSNVEIPREEQDAYEELLFDHDCIPVFLPKQLKQRFFNGFCKTVLWPMLHYVMPQSNEPFGELWDDYWQAYIAANSLYASVVTRAVESATDMIWVQNYHLLLLPSFLRSKLPRSKIGLFIHTPFPSSDVFRVLPTRQNLLSSMMAVDLIGFHTFDYARHFFSCIKRVMDLDFETLPGGALGVKYNGRHVSILISHVGIDSQLFQSLADSDGVMKRVTELKAQFPCRDLVFSISETDPVKGPLLTLQAFHHFLSAHPEWHEKMIFVEVIQPSTADGAAVRDSLLQEIQSIRKEFGQGAIHVIDAQKELPLPELVALYNASKVAVVSTFWDGLNLTPYEYTASQSSDHPGALVISEFTGCIRSLNGVLRVNPWSLEQVSTAIHNALSMSDEERRAHHASRFQYVMNHTIERWAMGFIEQLDRATKLGSELNFVQVGWGSNVKLMGLRSDFAHLDEDAVTTAYRKTNRRILLLDYDGTLTPVDKTIRGTRLIGPPPQVKKLLKVLSEDEENIVFLMSGRTRSILTDWFHDIPELGLAAEKGLFLKWPQRLQTCRQDRYQPPELTAESKNRAGGIAALHDEASGADGHVLKEVEVHQVIDSEWEYLIPLDDVSWKAAALELIRSYTRQTDGSWIEDKEFAIVWHYENADPEYGRMQAAELQKYLNNILANPNVDVVRYDYNRILEVKPHGISKGLATTAILESLLNKRMGKSLSHKTLTTLDDEAQRSSALAAHPSSPQDLSPISPPSGTTAASSNVTVAASSSVDPSQPPFLLVCGDDRSDEPMFLAVQNRDWMEGKLRGAKSALGKGKEQHVRDILSPRSIGRNAEPSDTEVQSKKEPADPFSFTVCVGMKPSNAHYFLHDDEEVLKILGALATASQRMQQARALDNAKLNELSIGKNNASQVKANLAKNAADIPVTQQGNPVRIGSPGSAFTALAGGGGMSAGKKAAQKVESEESESEPEIEYGSGSDEDEDAPGTTIDY